MFLQVTLWKGDVGSKYFEAKYSNVADNTSIKKVDQHVETECN